MTESKNEQEAVRLAKQVGSKIGRFAEVLPVPTLSKRSFLIFLAVFGILLTILAAYLPTYYAHLKTDKRAIIRSNIEPVGQALSVAVNEKKGIISGLSAFVITQNEQDGLSTNEFNTFAKHLFPTDNTLVTIGASPGGKIAYIYPYYAASIGINLVNDPRPDVRRDVARTIAAKKMIIAGPVLHSSSGKMVLVFREPIFNPDGTFWGLTNVSFEQEPFLKSTGLDELGKEYRFALKEKAGELLDADKTVFSMDPVTLEIPVPGDIWLIAVVPKAGWSSAINEEFELVVFAWVVGLFILATLIAGAVDRQNLLNKAIDRRTKELAKSNKDLERVNRLYFMITSINEAIIHATDEISLYEDVCRIAVDRGGFLMSWIGLVDEVDHAVNPVAMAGFVDGYLDEVNISAKDIPAGRGPTGTAIRENRTYISSDIDNDPIMEPWRAKALARGYHASGAFPIKAGDAAIGAFMVYDRNAVIFQPEETALMEEITADISFALEKFSQEKDLEHAASFPRANPSPIIEFHVGGLVLFHNEAAAKTLDRSGLSGQFEVFKPKDFPELLRLFVDNPGIATQYREVSIRDRIFGETITYFRDSETIRIYTMDITDKKTFEAELITRQEELEDANISLNRTLVMYEILNQVNEIIIKSNNMAEVNKAVCDVMIKVGNYDLCAIITSNPEKKGMDVSAMKGRDPSGARFLKSILSDKENGLMIRDELQQKRSIICRDLESSEFNDEFKTSFAQQNLKIFGAFPLLTAGRPLASIMIFSGDPGL